MASVGTGVIILATLWIAAIVLCIVLAKSTSARSYPMHVIVSMHELSIDSVCLYRKMIPVVLVIVLVFTLILIFLPRKGPGETDEADEVLKLLFPSSPPVSHTFPSKNT